jgi:O-antigen ligase
MTISYAREAVPNADYSLALIWLLAASSAFVVIEPAPFDILSVLMFAGFFATGLRAPAGAREPLLLLGIFVAANVLAAILVPDPVESLRSLSIRVFLVATWLLLVCLIRVDAENRTTALWNGYIFAAVISTCLGIAGYFDWFSSSEQLLLNGRVRSLFKDPNVFGPFLIPALLQLLVRMEERATRLPAISIGAGVLLVVGVLLSFSRGAWLNIVVSVLAYMALRLYFERQNRVRGRLLLASFALIVVGIGSIVVALSLEPVQDMFERRAGIHSYDLDAQGGRFATQFAALDRASSTPLGIGPGQSDNDRFFGMSTHNLYLHVLVESGWLGAAAFYGFLLLTLVRGWSFVKSRTPLQSCAIGVYAAIIGTLVQSFFIDSTHWRHMYLLFACLWGMALASPSAELHGQQKFKAT